MNYKQKVKEAQEVIQELKAGITLEQLEADLKKKGFLESQIGKIKESVDKLIIDEYGELIEKYLWEESLGEHLEEFDLVDADTFETIQYQALNKIFAHTNLEVNKYPKIGESKESILTKISNPFYGEELLDAQIKKYNYFNKPVGLFNVKF